jgi:hypothetical protein
MKVFVESLFVYMRIFERWYFFEPMMKALPPIERKFFCACKSKWQKAANPVPSSMAAQANDLKNLSCCRCAPPRRKYLLLQRLSAHPPLPAPVTLRFRNSSCCHAHVYYTPTRGTPQCRWMDGWMDGRTDGWMVFFLFLKNLLALLDHEI